MAKTKRVALGATGSGSTQQARLYQRYYGYYKKQPRPTRAALTNFNSRSVHIDKLHSPAQTATTFESDLKIGLDCTTSSVTRFILERNFSRQFAIQVWRFLRNDKNRDVFSIEGSQMNLFARHWSVHIARKDNPSKHVTLHFARNTFGGEATKLNLLQLRSMGIDAHLFSLGATFGLLLQA